MAYVYKGTREDTEELSAEEKYLERKRRNNRAYHERHRDRINAQKRERRSQKKAEQNR
jgi:hypothetical protein